jgi:hypothetical protein
MCGELALAIEAEAEAIELGAFSRGVPLTEEEAAARIIELLETVRYDQMSYEELHKQTWREPARFSDEWLSAQACVVVMNWCSLLTEASISPKEYTVCDSGKPRQHRVDPISEELKEGLRVYVAYFNQLNDEAKKRYLTLESPELERHILALIDGTATECYHNKMLRAADAKRRDASGPWGDWERRE